MLQPADLRHAALANYRIRYSLTPRQVGQFDAPDVFPYEMDPPGFENLTQNTPPGQIFKGNEDEIDRNIEKRLTRTNFFKYQEFQQMLMLDDEQMFELTGFDSESKAAFQAASEVLAESGADDFVMQDCDKQFAKIQSQIRKLIPRGQRESFNALSLLLFDALEFPAQNLASFANLEDWTEADEKKVRGVLTPFVNTNRKSVLDPGDVTISRQRTLQSDLESKVQAVLPANIRTAWQDAKRTYSSVYTAVQKYKEQ